MEQRADQHRYDVLDTAFRLRRRAAGGSCALRALLHDVGKPDCLRETGKFYAHDDYGEKIAKRILTSLRFPNKTVEEVSALVGGHMYDIQNQAKPDTLRTRFAGWGRERTMNQILLREADIRGCGFDTSYVAARWRALFKQMLLDGTPFSERELKITGEELKKITGLAEGRDSANSSALSTCTASSTRRTTTLRLKTLAKKRTSSF
jgi:hypothetical protein